MMPRFRQTDEILRIMKEKEHIRNVGIVAHIDHGKTTLTDSLLVDSGLLAPQVAGRARVLDYLQEEQERGITMKAAFISLLHKTERSNYLINLVDTPGHVDFTGKVTRALRAIDGAVVVVDAVEEIMAQTETVTRQALEARVKPVLFINKTDRLIKELKLSLDEIQKKLNHIIDSFNDLIELFAEPEFRKKWRVSYERGDVTFGSALDRWGFSSGNRTPFRFKEIVGAYENGQITVLQKASPIQTAILKMIIDHIPSPLRAQQYRIPRIWSGSLGSEIGEAMIKCQDNGPTIISLTNAQIDSKNGLTVTGRLFSGSVKSGDRLWLTGSRQEHIVKKVFVQMGAFREEVRQVLAGNLVAMSGLDSATAGETAIDSEAHKDIPAFERIRYFSEPVMTVALETLDPRDISRLAEALKRLSIEDPNMSVSFDDRTGQYLLSGLGELHLEAGTKLLKDYMEGAEITSSPPIIEYRETISQKGKLVMTKSPEKLNSIWITTEVLGKQDNEETLRKKHAHDLLAWEEHQNALICAISDEILPSDIKKAVVKGFTWACKSGPLCGEPLRGVRVEMRKIESNKEAVVNDPSQIARATSRAILGSMLTDEPLLLEPIYLIEVTAPLEEFGKCTNIVTARHGRIVETKTKGNMTVIRAHISVAETFGLSAEMRSSTSGRAFWQNSFDHWGKVPKREELKTIKKMRERKGLPPEPSMAEKFVDEIFQ